MNNDDEVEYTCTNCGEVVDENDKYCPKCGADVSEIQEEASKKDIIIKRIFVAGGIILSIGITISLFYYAFIIYSKSRLQNPPRMQVVFEANIPLYMQTLAKNKDNIYKTIMEEVNSELTTNQNKNVFELMQKKFSQKHIPMNRYFGDTEDNDSYIIGRLKDITIKALDRDEEVIRNRMEQYYVMLEPTIKKQSYWRILVELPIYSINGYNEKGIRQLLLGTGLLKFKLVKDPEFTLSIMKKIDDVLAGKKVGTDTSLASIEAAKQYNWEEFKKQHPFFSVAQLYPSSKTCDAYVRADEKDKLEHILARPEIQDVIPDNVEFDFGCMPFAYQNGTGFYLLFCVNKEPELTGSVITDAYAIIDPATSSPVVNIQMNSQGATEWAKITYYNVGRRIAIVMDGIVYSAPNIIGKVLDGNSQITGFVSLEEAKLLEIVLKAGPLAAPIKIISQNIIED